jgi:predicted RNA-binding Zn-ribbon protein involved in translation (DUF1610 family)
VRFLKKFITKTSAQASLEKKHLKSECSCPECGKNAIGVIATRSKGFFGVNIEKRKEFSCFWCGCQWNTGWH